MPGILKAIILRSAFARNYCDEVSYCHVGLGFVAALAAGYECVAFVRRKPLRSSCDDRLDVIQRGLLEVHGVKAVFANPALRVERNALASLSFF